MHPNWRETHFCILCNRFTDYQFKRKTVCDFNFSDLSKNLKNTTNRWTEKILLIYHRISWIAANEESCDKNHEVWSQYESDDWSEPRSIIISHHETLSFQPLTPSFIVLAVKGFNHVYIGSLIWQQHYPSVRDRRAGNVLLRIISHQTSVTHHTRDALTTKIGVDGRLKIIDVCPFPADCCKNVLYDILYGILCNRLCDRLYDH